MTTNSYFSENTLEELIEEIQYVYRSDDRPWIIGYSGGKDSTTVVELVYKMLLGLPDWQRHKMVYIVSSDTRIENPLIKIYLSKLNEMIGEAAERDGLPLKTAIVQPPADNSFWANVIGRGFPTPKVTGTFRWCTDRLKINPSAEFIRDIIKKESTEVVVVLGVRKAESIARKRRIEGRELANRVMNRHETIKGAYVYNPIVELTTEDVWDVLFQMDGGQTPWGSNNNELASLYSDADSGECPFADMNAGGQTQTCGNSRFGCWVCTVVKEDKSLNGFIKSGHRELIPLADFIKWLISIRNDEDIRETLAQLSFNMEVAFYILIALQVLFSISTVSLTAISREGKDAILIKYAPIDLYRQFLYKNVLQFILNIIVSVVVLGLLLYLIPDIGIVNTILIFLISIFTNLINSYTMLLVDLRKPNINWNSEYEVTKNSDKKSFQYGFMIIMVLILLYIGRLLENLNIVLGLTIEIAIFAVTFIIYNIILKKKINKVFNKIM